MSRPQRPPAAAPPPGPDTGSPIRMPAAAARPRHRFLRAVSLVLLVAALGSFGLGMVRISFSPALISELQQLSLGPLPAACVNGGIAAYSGLALAAGGAPSVNGSCLTQIHDTGQANLGVQPLALLALLVIVAAAALTAWGPRFQRLLTGGLCVPALALLGVTALDLDQVFAHHFHQGSSAISSGPDLGLWIVAALLLLVILAQLGSAGLEWARLALAPLDDGGRPPSR